MSMASGRVNISDIKEL